MKRLFLIWTIIAAITLYILIKKAPQSFLPPSLYLDNETALQPDDTEQYNPFSKINLPDELIMDNEPTANYLFDTAPVASTEKKDTPASGAQSAAVSGDQPTPKVYFFDQFDDENNSYWTGAHTVINARPAMLLPAIENDYFGVGTSYQPPSPIALYDDAMELKFAYFAGNTKEIYISFYNDSKNDNYHYKWRNIIPHSWQTASVPLRWFRDNEQLGKPLDTGDIISRLNFYAGSPADKPIIFIDDVMLVQTLKPKATVQSSGENIFSESFENTSRDWLGIITSDLPGQRSGTGIQAVAVDNQYFGVTASHEPKDPIFIIEKNPVVSLSYYVQEQENIYVSVYNKTKGDNYHYWIKKPTPGSWQSFTKSFLFFTDNSFKGIPISEGDEISSIRIFAGKPGQMVNLWIDDVKLEALENQAAPPFELKDRSLPKYTKINRSVIHHMRSVYNPDNRKKSVMNLGDSISESMAFMWPMRFNQPGMLVNEGYYYFEKTMSAQQSQKSGWGRQRIDTILKSVHPETITILFGTNDILLGGSPGAFYANMEYIVDRCLEHGSIPILLTIPPLAKKPLDQVRLYNYQLKQIAFEKQIPLVDIFTLFMDQKDWKSLLSDGVHPNYSDEGDKLGYNLINNAVYEMYKILELEVMKRPESTKSFIADGFDYCLPDDAQVIFNHTFERGSQGWGGSHTELESGGSSTGCIELQKGAELSAISNIDFTVTSTTYIGISVYPQNCQRFRVQLYNRTQKDNFWAARERLPQNQWTRYYFDLNSEFQDNENNDKYMFFEDIINNIQIYGDVIDSSSMLYIDDVIVYHAKPESYRATMLKQFNKLKPRYDEAIQHGTHNQLRSMYDTIKNNSDLELPVLKENFDRFTRLLNRAQMSNTMRSTFKIDSPPLAVGYDSAMRRISPYHPVYAFKGTFTDTINISAAQNEYEHFQLYIAPLTDTEHTVSIEFDDARHADGNALLSKDTFHWYTQDFVTTKRSWPVPSYRLGIKPDPLIPGSPFKLTSPQPVLCSVYVAPNTQPGRYSGSLRIVVDSEEYLRIPVDLTVRSYQIPKTGTLYTPTTLDFSAVESFYNKKIDQDTRRRWYAFCLQFRIDPTNLYFYGMSPQKEDIPFCLDLGLRTIILGGNHYSESIKNQDFIRSAYTYLSTSNLLDKSMIYIGDEPYSNKKARADIINKAKWVRESCPGLKTFAGTYPIDELIGYVDIWDPQIDEFNLQQSNERKNAGDEMMWYVAAAPSFPYPNVHIDNDLIESRILFWMTYKYGVQGFEYYYINLWGNNVNGRGGKKWPHVPWDPYTFMSSRNDYNGDGQLIYPGENMTPYPSLRLVAILDGIEDYEMLKLLESYRKQAQSQSDDPALQDLIKQSDAILAVPEPLVTGLRRYSRKPVDIERFRDKAGDLIEQFQDQLNR